MSIGSAGCCSSAIEILVIACHAMAFAQSNAALPRTATEVFQKANTATEAAVLSLADAMPEGKYSFVPTHGEFKNVRSFGQLLKHIAVDNYVDAASLLKEKSPIEIGEHENGPNSINSKEETLRFVRESFAYMNRALGTVNQQNLTEAVEFPGSSGGIPRLMIVNAAMADPWDIYGQMIEYLRMNGIDPQAKH